MFIGWIRKKTFAQDLEYLSGEILLDKNLILNTYNADPSLCFGIYDGSVLKAIITAYRFDQHILINSFSYLQDMEDLQKQKLLEILLKNIDMDKTVLFLANKYEKEIFNNLGFKKYANFKKAHYLGGAVFNFSSATAKSISGEDYIAVVKKLDEKVFHDDRFEYITKSLMKQSSLVLSTPFGFLHSYALDKSIIKIAPYCMVNEAFDDAEKLLRGVIYHRGLKNIIGFIPSDIKEIVDLYEKYKFNLKEEYELLYLNSKPQIKLESVYSF